MTQNIPFNGNLLPPVRRVVRRTCTKPPPPPRWPAEEVGGDGNSTDRVKSTPFCRYRDERVRIYFFSDSVCLLRSRQDARGYRRRVIIYYCYISSPPGGSTGTSDPAWIILLRLYSGTPEKGRLSSSSSSPAASSGGGSGQMARLSEKERKPKSICEGKKASENDGPGNHLQETRSGKPGSCCCGVGGAV